MVCPLRPGKVASSAPRACLPRGGRIGDTGLPRAARGANRRGLGAADRDRRDAGGGRGSARQARSRWRADPDRATPAVPDSSRAQADLSAIVRAVGRQLDAGMSRRFANRASRRVSGSRRLQGTSGRVATCMGAGGDVLADGKELDRSDDRVGESFAAGRGLTAMELPTEKLRLSPAVDWREMILG